MKTFRPSLQINMIKYVNQVNLFMSVEAVILTVSIINDLLGQSAK